MVQVAHRSNAQLWGCLSVGGGGGREGGVGIIRELFPRGGGVGQLFHDVGDLQNKLSATGLQLQVRT